MALGSRSQRRVGRGVIPALKATGRNLQVTMQRSAGRGSGIRFGRLSSLLVVAEVIMAVWFLSLGSALLPGPLRPEGLGSLRTSTSSRRSVFRARLRM